MLRTALASLAACVLVAPAVGQIRFFFDRAGVGEQEDRGSVDPLSYTNPVVIESGRYYLYAEYHDANNLWIAVGLRVNIVGDATFTDANYYQHRLAWGSTRWTSRDVLFSTDRKQVRLRAAWIGDPSQRPGGAWNWDEAEAQRQTGNPDNSADAGDPRHYRRAWDSHGGMLGTTLLGYVDVAGSAAELYISAETLSCLGGCAPGVYFGFLDGPDDNPLHDAVVLPCDACDMNCDGAVNASDIEPFLGLLFEGDSPCSRCAGDTNGDGSINASDIEGFIDCLFG